jgi:RND family efflux transporter MFP subunit
MTLPTVPNQSRRPASSSRAALATSAPLPRGSTSLLLHTLLAAAALLFLASCHAPPPPPPPPQVTVAQAIGRKVADWDEFTGRFEAVNSVEVRPRVSGYVQRVAFSEGATVPQGAVLFVIDQRPYEAEVERAEADLAQARTREELAASELQRAGELLRTQAISREEFDARTSGRAESSAAVSEAEAALKTARLNLEWTTVRAPISGRVGRAEVTPGNLVQAGPPSATLLTTIVSLDPIYVYFDADELAYLKFLKSVPGKQAAAARARTLPVSIGLANETGFPHEGRIDFLDNRVDGTAGTIRVRAVLRNPDRQFAPGLFARVKLVSGNQYAATLIDDRAVGTDQDRKFVLVLKPDSSVEYRAVELGPTVDGLRVVRSGLQPGEDIVVKGLQRVRPGMKVVAARASMSDNTVALLPSGR